MTTIILRLKQIVQSSTTATITLAGVVFFVCDIIDRTIHRHWTVWDWPALDTYPFIMRLADSQYLVRDFYTNTLSHMSPRTLYADFIFGLSQIFHCHFVKIFIVIQSLIVPLFFVALVLILITLGNRLGSRNQAVNGVVSTIVGVGYFFFHQPFILADWEFYPTGTHQWLIALVILLYALVILLQTQPHRLVLWSLLGLASLCHSITVIVAFPLFFFLDWILHPNTSHLWRISHRLAVSVGVILISVATILGWLQPEPVYAIYLQFHGFHYLPSTWLSPSWVIVVTIFQMVLLGSTIWGMVKRETKLAAITGLFFVYNLIVILTQYFFVEVLMNTAWIILSPSRGLVFIGLEVVIVIYIVIFVLAKKYSGFEDTFLASQVTVRLQSIWMVINCLAASTFLILLVVYFYTLQSPLLNPAAITQADRNIDQFIERRTDRNSLFIVPQSSLILTIPLVAQRAIVIGYYFPFNKQDWPTFKERHDDIISYPSTDIVTQDDHYYKLTAEQIVQLGKKYQAQYFVTEIGLTVHNYSFPILFQDNHYTLYSLPDF